MSPPVHSILAHRSSGVLLHISSLPGPHGSGDLGAGAFHFVDWLVSGGQRLWQILPLSPAGSGNSPYHSPSTFAGNPLLVDLDELEHNGWLAPGDTAPNFAARYCDFEQVVPYRMARLDAAWRGFRDKARRDEWTMFEHFRSKQAAWLEGYALFTALEAHYGAPWTLWPDALARRESAALAQAYSARSSWLRATICASNAGA